MLYRFPTAPNRQGLSHYLEHMLFMGSGRYPNENDYDEFLNKHGGSSNAYTELVGPDHTGMFFLYSGARFVQRALVRAVQRASVCAVGFGSSACSRTLRARALVRSFVR